jgi:hypothetical protein
VATRQSLEVKRRKHVAIQLAPLLELYNPPRFDRSVVRSEILFKDLLESPEMDRITRRELRGFDLGTAFEDATGLKLENYRELILAVVSWILPVRLPPRFVEYLLNRTAPAVDTLYHGIRLTVEAGSYSRNDICEESPWISGRFVVGSPFSQWEKGRGSGLTASVLSGGLREMSALPEPTHLAHASSSGRSLKPSPNPVPEGEGSEII